MIVGIDKARLYPPPPTGGPFCVKHLLCLTADGYDIVSVTCAPDFCGI